MSGCTAELIKYNSNSKLIGAGPNAGIDESIFPRSAKEGEANIRHRAWVGHDTLCCGEEKNRTRLLPVVSMTT